MFCRQCGKELEEGRRFCVFCGADQLSAAAGAGARQQAAAPQPGQAPAPHKRRMETWAIVLIAAAVVLVLAGAGVGIYFAASGSSKNEPVTSQPSTIKTPKVVIPEVKSERLAYISSKDVYSVNMNGAGARRLTSRGDIVDFAVSPDGTWIAFVTNPGNQSVIFKMHADGSNVSQVTLPEKGRADNPAFDPTGKSMYFTRVTTAEEANIEAGQPFAEDFERYDIAANSVSHLYTYGGLQEQSIQGLWADPAGGDLYFNLFGSDYPSSVPHMLTLGPPATDSVYLPMQRDTGKYSAVAFQMTGFSRDGAYVSYFKQMLFAEQDTTTTQGQQVDAAFRNASSGSETSVADYVPGTSQVGEVSGMEFSRIADATYYYSMVAAGNTANSLTLNFYKGTTKGSPALSGLNVTVPVDQQQYTPLVWHLVPAQ
ncbi:MAG TPA: zinc-ribbon domain-containing protein [Candidatus Anoxymicrobiaceae bacterium]